MREEGRRRDPPLARSVTRPHWIKRNFRVGPAGGRGARAVPGCAYIARAPGDGHGGGHGVGSGVNRRVRSSQCAEQSPAAVEPRGHGPLQSLELTLSYLSLYHISTVTNHEFQDRRFEMSTREQSAKSGNETSTAFSGFTNRGGTCFTRARGSTAVVVRAFVVISKKIHPLHCVGGAPVGGA